MSKERTCKVDAVVTVDAKGQIVLPKDLREKAEINSGDKLALVGCLRGREVCCIMLMKAEKLGNSVKLVLGPVLKDIFE